MQRSIRAASQRINTLNLHSASTGRIRSIERATGKDNRHELAAQPYFNAEVVPNLPAASSRAALLSLLPSFETPAKPVALTGTASTERLLVRTVAAQVTSRSRLSRQLAATAAVTEETDAGQRCTSALLLVSGSHPWRDGPLRHSSLLTSGTELVRTAAAMRHAGLFQGHPALWTAENPLRHDVSRMLQKVDAGADVIVTQPPLLWSRFGPWFDSVHRSGVLSHAKLVVGIPCITSPGNMAFWLQLCKVEAADADAAAELGTMGRAAASGAAACDAFFRDWNLRLMQQVAQLPDIAGAHFMPVTPKGQALLLSTIKQHIMPL